MGIPGVEVWTVEHFHVEVAKVLRRAVLQKLIDDETATSRVLELTDWKLRVVRTRPLLAEAWKLRHNLIIHDALYVVLAHQLGATLVTGDRKLVNAPGVDVPIRTV